MSHYLFIFAASNGWTDPYALKLRWISSACYKTSEAKEFLRHPFVDPAGVIEGIGGQTPPSLKLRRSKGPLSPRLQRTVHLRQGFGG